MLSLDQLTTFLRNARWPQVPERRPTFFSIAGFPHYENVLSNVYQFFFSTDSPHGLGSLCMDALLEVINNTIKQSGRTWQPLTLQRVTAERELSTGNGRLDLLLHDGHEAGQWQSASAVVLIENKVYHWLANDLGDYWDFIEKGNATTNKIGVVLGLNRETIPPARQNNWIAITHLDWAQAVERRLGPLLHCADSRYVILLLELIENIRTMTNSDESFMELLAFYQQNRSEIGRAGKIRDNVFLGFPDALKSILLEYNVWTSKGAAKEGWLIIHSSDSKRFKYVLGYYEVFHEYETIPTYRIELVGDEASNSAKDLQAQLLVTSHTAAHGLQADNRASHHVISKTYSLPQDTTKSIVELIANSFRTDWQPLEKYWLKEDDALTLPL